MILTLLLARERQMENFLPGEKLYIVLFLYFYKYYVIVFFIWQASYLVLDFIVKDGGNSSGSANKKYKVFRNKSGKHH